VERFDSTSWSLVTSAASGNRADGDAFTRQYAPLIRRYLAARWNLASQHDQVVEGCQEVLMQLFKPDGALAKADRTAGEFRGFLYGVVRNVALMIERKERRRRRLVGSESAFDPETVEDSEATLSQVFDRGWAEMLAEEARRRLAVRLGEERRDAYTCLELRYVDGLPPREIAKRVGRDVKEIYQLLRSARSEYRAALLDVMAEIHPDCTPDELERKWRELTRVL